MSWVMVRYKVKRSRVEENEALVRAVYDELERTRPVGIRYATFSLEDGVSFVHFASVETADGHDPLAELKAFTEFRKGIADRCDRAPEAIELREVGAFRLFG